MICHCNEATFHTMPIFNSFPPISYFLPPTINHEVTEQYFNPDLFYLHKEMSAGLKQVNNLYRCTYTPTWVLRSNIIQRNHDLHCRNSHGRLLTILKCDCLLKSLATIFMQSCNIFHLFKSIHKIYVYSIFFKL